MSHSNGEVRFNDGSIKHFEYNGTSDICIPKLYDTYDEMIDNYRTYNTLAKENNIDYNKTPWYKRILLKYKGDNKKINMCNHNEELVEIYTNYGGGFYWNGTACRNCNMLLKGTEPFADDNVYTNGIPEWAEKSYD